MSKKKVIAIAFSDLHINDWSKFNKDNQRTLNHFKVLSILVNEAEKNECPLSFCGDLLHKGESISNELLEILNQELIELQRVHQPWYILDGIIAISGNHDCSSTNTKDKPSSSWVKTLSNIYKIINCIDFKYYESKSSKIRIYGVPYLDHNLGLNDYIKDLEIDKSYRNLLLLHTDYPGARDTDGMEVGTVENLNTNLLQKFDLVLIGHIHKPQRLSKKVYMVGAPLQQRRTDKNCNLGYLKIYDDLSVKFVNLSDSFPKFIDVEKEEDIKDDGNYYTVIDKRQINEGDSNVPKITKSLSKKRLVRRYMKARGIKDDNKSDTLINILKQAES